MGNSYLFLFRSSVFFTGKTKTATFKSSSETFRAEYEETSYISNFLMKKYMI